MTFDPSHDIIDILDFTEPVVVCSANGQSFAVPHTLRFPAAVEEAAPSNGRSVVRDARWRLPRAECPLPPEPGDRIVDAAGRPWTILVVRENAVLGWWKCDCRDARIAAGLDNAVTIERVEYAPDGSAAWHVWRTGVRARIQPTETRIEAGRTVRRFDVLLCFASQAEQVAVDHHCRIRAADGSLYRITGSRRSDRLAELPVIEAETSDP